MKLNIFIKTFIALFFFFIGDALASEGSVNIGKFLFGLFNFALFAFLFYKFVLSAIFDFFAKRGDVVEGEIEKAAREKEEITKTFNTLVSKLEKIAQEIVSIKEDAKKHGEKVKDGFIESAKQRADFIIKESGLMADREAADVSNHLRKKVLELSTRIAEENLKQRLKGKEQSALIDSSIRQLEVL